MPTFAPEFAINVPQDDVEPFQNVFVGPFPLKIIFTFVAVVGEYGIFP